MTEFAIPATRGCGSEPCASAGGYLGAPARTPRRNTPESGFAILLVFVLAAVIAISLYYELPRVMFEGTRQREQLLIDRGEQYSLAVRRFYVKFGRWPAKMDDLENTNNIRCLRRQYRDPMTGEVDWRIIHEAAGVLTDSLVHPATQQTPGQNAAGGSQTFGTLTSSQPFGSSLSSSSSDAASDEPAPMAWGLLLRPSDRGPLGTAHGGVSAGDETGQPASADAAGSSNPNPSTAGAANPAAGAAGAAPDAGTGSTAVAQAIQTSLMTGRPFPGTTSGQNPAVAGGGIGIAGVASKSELQGIKRYKDKSKYKEWEFVFDMSALQQLQNPQQQPQTQPQQAQPQQTQPQQAPPQPGGGTPPGP
jgi:hypothetical protein